MTVSRDELYGLVWAKPMTHVAKQFDVSSSYLARIIDYKISWERELERRERLDITGPEPLPHPDDIIVDPRNDKVWINGPVSKEEKVEWDKLRARKAECDASIADSRKMLQDESNSDIRARIEDDIRHEQRIWDIISKLSRLDFQRRARR